MHATVTVQELSEQIIDLASEIMGMSQGMRDMQYAAFLHGTPAQRQPIVAALHLSPAQVLALVSSAGESAAGIPSAKPGASRRQPQPWDYDTTAATVPDLTTRRDLLRTRLHVLRYLRSLKHEGVH